MGQRMQKSLVVAGACIQRVAPNLERSPVPILNRHAVILSKKRY